MQADLKTVQTELMEETGLSLAKEDTNFFDYLHLSPLKVNNLNKSSFVIKKKNKSLFGLLLNLGLRNIINVLVHFELSTLSSNSFTFCLVLLYRQNASTKCFKLDI